VLLKIKANPEIARISPIKITKPCSPINLLQKSIPCLINEAEIIINRLKKIVNFDKEMLLKKFEIFKY